MKNETTPMTLSSEAQAVLNAAYGASCYGPDDCLNESVQIAIATLRAAAKPFHWTWNAEMCHKHLVAIADELEAQ